MIDLSSLGCFGAILLIVIALCLPIVLLGLACLALAKYVIKN